MLKSLTLMLGICLCCTCSFAQIAFNGSASSTSTDNNASLVIVDNALVITTTHSIDGARVAITSNYVSGDNLDYTAALLPAGVTGSYNAGLLTFTGIASASDYQALLRSVTFRASANGASNRVIEFYLGSTYFNTTNNHFYQYVPSADISWTSAKAAAASRNYFGLTGYLATITSISENQLIQGLVPTNDVNAAAWIGASDEVAEVNAARPGTYPGGTPQWVAEYNFYWVTGPEAGTRFSTGTNSPVAEPGQYINWRAGEPNGYNGENHVEIRSNGGWNDNAINGWNLVDGYIVEFVGFAGEPTLDVTHSRTVVVMPTILTPTSSARYHPVNSSVTVDDALELESGGMVTDARVTISGNFASGDVLSYTGSLPSGVSASYNSTTGVLSFTGTARPSDWQALFRTVTFVSSSPSTSDRTITFSVGNMISGQNGHFYEFVSATTSSWAAARDAAAARTYMGLQGYLATITSQQENQFIYQKLVSDGWLGGADAYNEINTATGATTYADQNASEGNFYWVTGPEKGQLISYGNGSPVAATPLTYMNWYSGEPNNAGGEHYLKMYSGGVPGTWNDMPLNASVGMMVEYGGLPTDPGIVLSASRVLTNFIGLPVQNLRIELKEKDGSVIINWTVDEEENVSHYNLLRGDKSSSLGKIDAVKALDRNGKITYTYTDNNTLKGISYYQIAVVDKDAKQTLSAVRSITIKGKLQVYPTVFNRYFAVNQSHSTAGLLTITNADGATILKKTIGQGITNIDAGFLTSGVYFVQISNGGGKPEVFKMIKR